MGSHYDQLGRNATHKERVALEADRGSFCGPCYWFEARASHVTILARCIEGGIDVLRRRCCQYWMADSGNRLNTTEGSQGGETAGIICFAGLTVERPSDGVVTIKNEQGPKWPFFKRFASRYLLLLERFDLDRQYCSIGAGSQRDS